MNRESRAGQLRGHPADLRERVPDPFFQFCAGDPALSHPALHRDCGHKVQQGLICKAVISFKGDVPHMEGRTIEQKKERCQSADPENSAASQEKPEWKTMFFCDSKTDIRFPGDRLQAFEVARRRPKIYRFFHFRIIFFIFISLNTLIFLCILSMAVFCRMDFLYSVFFFPDRTCFSRFLCFLCLYLCNRDPSLGRNIKKALHPSPLDPDFHASLPHIF